MAVVTIAGQRFPQVSREIFRRSPTVDSAFLPITGGFSVRIDESRNELLLTTAGGIVLVRTRETQHFLWDSVQGWDGRTLRVGEQCFVINSDTQDFSTRFADLLKDNVNEDTPTTPTKVYADVAYQSSTLPLERITTLQELPGHVTVHGLGLVGSLQAASGFTAGAKGRSAMESVLRDLASQAHAAGANAITGLNSNAFGAGGGITGVLGGDAVGVLLVGTAVHVVPIEDDAEDQHEQ